LIAQSIQQPLHLPLKQKLNSVHPTDSPKHLIYTVSKLTAGIKDLLENKFPFVWLTAEISNFSIPVSGHFYFTLKDEHAQISAVMFRGQNRNLKFLPENGMNITGLGRISVYEPRGAYQIIFEYLEPKGIGDMQVAFEQLKARLSEEGLFDQKRKQPLPFLPHKIAIITSPTGAVVHDILKVVNRRFPNIHICILPVKVQGNGADNEIAAAIELLNSIKGTDVAILARGGGSIEDLSAFNSEIVARAIFKSLIPIISAVGHETDFTIADFVADLRAPTPSAAAELMVPLKFDLVQRCDYLKKSLTNQLIKYIEQLSSHVTQLVARLVDPGKKIQDFRLKTDDVTAGLIRRFNILLGQKHERLIWWIGRLITNNPQMQIDKVNEKLYVINYNLFNYIKIILNNKKYRVSELTARLNALSPIAVLKRGYSITRTIPDANVVMNSGSVQIGQDLEILLAKGTLICRVGRKPSNVKKNV